MSRGALPLGAACRLVDRVVRRDEIPLVLCIDVEPDARVFDPRDPSPWRGFEHLVEQLPSLRERLAEITAAPARFTWCLRMDPQVAETWGSPGWVPETYPEVLTELQAQGDELGLHIHLWRWEEDAGAWIVDHDPAWGTHCVTMALDSFEAAFGRTCAVHRGGDHFLSGTMLARLVERGVTTDLTVEPGLAPRGPVAAAETGLELTPDYRGMPTAPYRSTPESFPAFDPASRADPLLIPLASAPGRRVSLTPLSLWTGPPRFALRLTAGLLQRAPQVLAFAVRTNATLGPEWEAVVRNLDHLARHPNMQFVTASAAAARLEPALSRA